MGLTIHATVSPGVERKIVYAGASASFETARTHLHELADLEVSSQRIRRLTLAVAKQRDEERKKDVNEYDALPIPKQSYGKPDKVVAPPIACVMVDGGRLQIRDRIVAQVAEIDKVETNEAASLSIRKGKHWRESRVGCALSMQGPKHADDPMPLLPSFLKDIPAISKLLGEMGHGAALDLNLEGFSLESQPKSDDWPCPDVLVRSVVATRETWADFGKMLASEAWKRGFGASQRKAFVADGSSNNWSVHSRYFPQYTPILDILHALGYCYQAATASRRNDEGVIVYLRWAQLIWSGKVTEVVKELKVRQLELGETPPDVGDDDPRRQVSRARTYFENQASRMNYPQYRKQGLPITSSQIESTIKQINQRVKGSEKFWSSCGGNGMLGLRADIISDTKPLQAFWKRRAQSIDLQLCT